MAIYKKDDVVVCSTAVTVTYAGTTVTINQGDVFVIMETSSVLSRNNMAETILYTIRNFSAGLCIDITEDALESYFVKKPLDDPNQKIQSRINESVIKMIASAVGGIFFGIMTILFRAKTENSNPGIDLLSAAASFLCMISVLQFMDGTFFTIIYLNRSDRKNKGLLISVLGITLGIAAAIVILGFRRYLSGGVPLQ